MSESTQRANVIPLHVKPKVITGGKRNVSYRITFNRAASIAGEPPWEWEVTIQLAPQVFRGATYTQNEAITEVQSFMKTTVL